MARLTPEQWQAIRTVWEYDPGEPSLTVAAERAAKKHNFGAPSKGAVSKRMAADAEQGSAWERRASLSGINKAAHRRADAMVDSTGEKETKETKETAGAPENGNAVSAQAARDESEEKRAAVLARHRTEWSNIGVLLNEALQIRNTDSMKCSEKLRAAKLAAEITRIKQEGERKAWGLDDLADFDPSKMTDEELERFIRGRS